MIKSHNHRNLIINILVIISMTTALISTAKPMGLNAVSKSAYEFQYTNGVQEWECPKTGKYYLEVVGASGGGYTDSTGLGGKATGYYNLYKGEKLYVYVGGQGVKTGNDNRGGYNGGGDGIDYSGSGGGATDIRLVKGSENDRLLVAGGGGGTSAAGQLGGNAGINGLDINSNMMGKSSLFVGHSGSSEDGSGKYTGAGGGGYRGGGQQSMRLVGGNGGTNYIGKVYNGTTTVGTNKNNGRASIEYIGEVESTITINLGRHTELNGKTGTVTVTGVVGTELDLSSIRAHESFQIKSILDKSGNEHINKKVMFTYEASTFDVLVMQDLVLEGNLEQSIYKLNWDQNDNYIKEYRLQMTSNNRDWFDVSIADTGLGTVVYPSTLIKSTINQSVPSYKAPYTGVYKVQLYGQKGGDAVTQYKEDSEDVTTGNRTVTIYGAPGSFVEGYVFLTKGQVINSEYYGGGGGSYKSVSGHGGYMRGSSGTGGTGIGLRINGNMLAASGGGAGGFVGRHRDAKHGFQVHAEIGRVSASPNPNWSSTSGSGGGITSEFNSGGDDDYKDVHLGGGGGGYTHGGSASYSGNSYINSGLVFNNIEMTQGGNQISYGANNGSVYATVQPVDVEVISAYTRANVPLEDYAKPNAVTNINIANMDTSNVTVGWDKPDDIGTQWKAKVDSYMEDVIVQQSNTVDTTYTSGIKGYHYYIDKNSTGTVTKSHQFVNTNKVTTGRANYDTYIHIAALDNAGNLGGTRSEKIPIAAMVKYDINITSTNVCGDTVTSTPKGLINPQLVYFGGHANVKGNVTNTSLGDTAFTKQGYKFVGWSTNKDMKATVSGNNITYNGTFIPIGTKLEYNELMLTYSGILTLYAIWEPIQYDIVYDGNNNWNTGQNQYSQKVRYDQRVNLLQNLFTRNNNSTVGNKVYKEGYGFIGWGAIKKNNIQPYNLNTADYSNKQSVINLCNEDNKEYRMYALWVKNLQLTFNMNTGLRNGSPDNIVLKSTIWNNVMNYNYKINNGITPTNEPYYTVQDGKIDAYGVYNIDGVNSVYRKSHADGTMYRFLGWNTNKDAKVPDTKLNVYNSTRLNTLNIQDNTTLYAIWEPVLYTKLTTTRSIGSLDKNLIESVSAYASTANPYTVLLIKPGEQSTYSLRIRGNAQSVKVTFDKSITDIYDIKGEWTDELNPNPTTSSSNIVDGISVGATHGLNRNPKVSNNITRKFYIPQYLGTSKSEPGSIGKKSYTIRFKIVNPDSFYYKYKYNKNEEINISTLVYLYSNEDDISSILKELQSKLKIRLKDY